MGTCSLRGGCKRRRLDILERQPLAAEQPASASVSPAKAPVDRTAAELPRAAALLDATFDAVAEFLDARALACMGRAFRTFVLPESRVRWLADQRRGRLLEGLVRGDLMLAETHEGGKVDWSLQRLHIAEAPPRFPRLYFQFASDRLTPAAHERIREVVEILRRFPGLCIRIEGFAQPDAPPALGRALAQSRAATTRRTLLLELQRDAGPRATGANPWAGEDSDVGVSRDSLDEPRGRGYIHAAEFYSPKLIGYKIQAAGRWDLVEDRNANFNEDVDDADTDASFRRVDFTITGLLECVPTAQNPA